ncbi:MAG: SGNH/GDSL hydrolase family protein [Rikenellaceae bacterium]
MKNLLIFILSVTSYLCSAQVATDSIQPKWHNPELLGAKIHGQLLQNEVRSNYYYRLPNNVEKNIRPAVWNLSHNSAGESLKFYTNSSQIIVRYVVSEEHASDHMAATGKSGVDLYATENHGQRKWCAATRVFADTIVYKYTGLYYEGKMHDFGFEYQLYLPTYNTVEWLEIGVDEEAYFKFAEPTAELPIIAYGTSITQGACASRPGMIWSSIVSREMDIPLMNLGFSGNGALEKGIIDIIKRTPARAVILDCLPNLCKMRKDKLVELTVNSVKEIRKAQPNVPIIITDHLGYPHGKMQEVWQSRVENGCEANLEAYRKLLAEGYLNLHHLTYREIAMPEDATVEAIHPSDWGMRVYADAYIAKLNKALNMPTGELATQIPVKQRREAQTYEWLEHHNNKMLEAQKVKPKTVVLGNSIMHRWGGSVNFKYTCDSVGWKKATSGKKVVNMGASWDRIENVLWRVTHGALDGYSAERVIVAIGVNNLIGVNKKNISTHEEIAEGIRTLIQAIKVRQPKAEIKVCGIFPARSLEADVIEVNKLIENVAKEEKVKYGDPGVNLLMSNGKANQSLYQNDGLHLNLNGYRKIVASFFE